MCVDDLILYEFGSPLGIQSLPVVTDERSTIRNHSRSDDSIPRNQITAFTEDLYIATPSLLFITETLCQLLSPLQLDLTFTDLFSQFLLLGLLIIEQLLQFSNLGIDFFESSLLDWQFSCLHLDDVLHFSQLLPYGFGVGEHSEVIVHALNPTKQIACRFGSSICILLIEFNMRNNFLFEFGYVGRVYFLLIELNQKNIKEFFGIIQEIFLGCFEVILLLLTNLTLNGLHDYLTILLDVVSQQYHDTSQYYSDRFRRRPQWFNFNKMFLLEIFYFEESYFQLIVCFCYWFLSYLG